MALLLLVIPPSSVGHSIKQYIEQTAQSFSLKFAMFLTVLSSRQFENAVQQCRPSSPSQPF